MRVMEADEPAVAAYVCEQRLSMVNRFRSVIVQRNERVRHQIGRKTLRLTADWAFVPRFVVKRLEGVKYVVVVVSHETAQWLRCRWTPMKVSVTHATVCSRHKPKLMEI